MSEWQPIETAPKDGTKILIYLPAINNIPATIKVSEWIDRTTLEFGKVIGEYKYWYDPWGGIGTGILAPTHWMRIPSPPETLP